jgi:VIT1/CCC1 family predicted Fe2+/Mn2+ transporter
MGASGYLAAVSEREVHEHEIAMEREEIRLMPEVETEELALLYQAKGIPAADAQRIAAEVMKDPEKALAEKVRDELGIGEPSSTPLREGIITGSATAIGALITVVPFLFDTGPWAIWTGIATAFGAFIPVAPLLVSTEPWAIWASFAIAMLSHFLVGAARSVFTGRGLIRSGLDMFLVGLGVAVAGYFLGDWIVRLL